MPDAASSAGQATTYLVNVQFSVGLDHVRRIPQTAANHGVECALIYGDVDAGAGHGGHVADVLFEELDAGVGGGAQRTHLRDDYRGEIETELVFVGDGESG